MRYKWSSYDGEAYEMRLRIFRSVWADHESIKQPVNHAKSDECFRQ